MDKETKTTMTVSEMGKRGAAKMLANRGREYMAEIGRKGGNKTKERLGSEHYRKAGEKGAAVTNARPDHLRTMSAKGAAVNKRAKEIKAAKAALDAFVEEER